MRILLSWGDMTTAGFENSSSGDLPGAFSMAPISPSCSFIDGHAARTRNMMLWHGVPWWAWHIILGGLCGVVFVPSAVIAIARFSGPRGSHRDYFSRDEGILG